MGVAFCQSVFFKDCRSLKFRKVLLTVSAPRGSWRKKWLPPRPSDVSGRRRR